MKEDQDIGLSSLFDYDLDVDARIVYLHDEINEKTALRCIKSLMHLDWSTKDEDSPKVGLFINSPGGNLEDAFALYDCIQGMRARVMTIGTGTVASAAVLLLACGTAGRYATENCWVMAHQAETGASGDETTMASVANAFTKFEKQRYDLLARHTKWTSSEWRSREKEKGEIWMSPKEMLKIGLIDSIFKPVQPMPAKKRTRK